MPSAPWSILKRKRGTLASAPPSRKQSRTDDTSSSSTTRQQTLTQAQWVSSAPAGFVDDASLAPAEVMPRQLPSRKLSKRDSTLTQMPFFDCALLQREKMDFGLLAAHEDEVDLPLPIPQGDAAYDSPRMPRKRKPSISIASDRVVKKTHQTQGSRDYRPSPRKSNETTMTEARQPRRTSRRIAQRATILSDPAENLDFFEQALSPLPPKSRTDQRKAGLVIQDSTATDDEVEYWPTQSQLPRHHDRPSTPLKKSTFVRSSQTPETPSPSTRTDRRSGVNLRSVLRERSINLPTLHPATPKSDHKSMSAPRMTDNPIVATPKLSKKHSIKSKGRVEDSQANIWSLPETSSPRKQQHSQSLLATGAQEQVPTMRRSLSVNGGSEKLEIPSTSQVVGMHRLSAAFESNESLPSLHELTDRPTRHSTPTKQLDMAATKDTEAEAEIDNKPTHEKATSHQLEEVEDSESSFGSPIANDTQFQFDLKHRTSSPTTSQSRSSETRQSRHDAQRLSDVLRPQVGEELETGLLDRTMASPVPTPRLIPRSSAEAEIIGMSRNDSSTEELFPWSGQPEGFSTAQVTTTRVPLNDVQPDAQASSSPALPSNKSITQWSIHPASMPHPSQISTQEATQAYLGQSSMILGEEVQIPQGTVKITIKDSSSMRMTMSQIPAHRASQSEMNVDMKLDELDNYDEYDLDPPSSDVQPPTNAFCRSKTPVKVANPSADVPAPPQPATPPRPGDEGLPRDDEETEPSPSQIPFTENSDAAGASSPPSSQRTPPLYSPLKGQYSPISGFNNETQSNFTQHGHVTAAYIHRQREKGALPKWYVPKPYQVPGYTRR